MTTEESDLVWTTKIEVNSRTGEIISKRTYLARSYKPKKGSKVPFAALFGEGATHLRTSKLQGMDHELFLHLWSQLRYQNYLTISPTALASDLKVRPQQISRSLKHLRDKRILFQGADRVTYRMSPMIGYKGSADEQMKARKDFKAGIFAVVNGGPYE